MSVVTISPQYQVVIPPEICKLIGINPGQKMQVIAYDNQVLLIPIRPVREARGSLKGIDARDLREEVDEPRV